MKKLNGNVYYTGFFRVFKDVEGFNTFVNLINQYTTLNMYNKGWTWKTIQPNLGFDIEGDYIGKPMSSMHPEEEPSSNSEWKNHLNLSNQGIEVFLQYFIKHFPDKIKNNASFNKITNSSSLIKIIR
jgi:hypothetical protein